MKKLIMMGILSLLSFKVFAQTETAKIFATNSEDEKVVITYDSKDGPVVQGNAKASPTIKDFREEAEYYAACYAGKDFAVKNLLTALVAAADGDGDSWAELKNITKNSNAEFEVVVNITDESGENEEVYLFPACK